MAGRFMITNPICLEMANKKTAISSPRPQAMVLLATPEKAPIRSRKLQ
jgi:hypothetical protein